MIKEFEKYHGAVFARLFHESSQKVAIELYPSKSNSSYIINNKLGIYIKHSTKRLSPWSFTFTKIHQDEILKIKNKYGEVFTVLVCHNDGIVCLSFEELKLVLDHHHEETEWVRISRGPRQKYTVAGKNGKLKFKIGENEFPEKIFTVPNPKPGIFSWFINK